MRVRAPVARRTPGRRPFWMSVLGVALVCGCSAGAPTAADSGRDLVSSSAGAATARQSAHAPRQILYFGNSHTSVNDVPGTVARLLQAGAGVSVESTVSPHSLLLNERGSHQLSLDLLGSRRWDVVVLQAQDYSSSGAYTYPTTGAEELVRRARAGGARVILFAEWPRAGIDESVRIVATYAAIAARQPACLPPVPEAFDEALKANPTVALHNADGNHSSPAGAFLAALVLASAIAPLTPDRLPDLDQPGVAIDVQRALERAAARTLNRVPATRGC